MTEKVITLNVKWQSIVLVAFFVGVAVGRRQKRPRPVWRG